MPVLIMSEINFIKINFCVTKMEVEPKKNAIVVGYETETEVIKILQGFDSVTSVRRDRHKSTIDLYYTLKGEKFTRCLQVKTIFHSIDRPTEYQFHISSQKGYNEGMLIIALKWESEPKFGFIHHYERKDGYGVKSISMKQSSTKTYKAVPWEQFLSELEKALSTGLDATRGELLKKSMPISDWLSFQSQERFQEFSLGHGLNIEWNDDPSSKTDLCLNGFKATMKFCSNLSSGHNFYSFRLKNSRTHEAKYKKGDNDFYIFEVGGRLGDFVFIPEYLLLDENNKIKMNVQIYTPEYIEKKKDKRKFPGFWTGNKKYWISSENGCLGSNYDVDVHIENLFENSEEEVIEMEIF